MKAPYYQSMESQY